MDFATTSTHNLLSMRTFVPSDGVILDVGANAGLLTLVFAKQYVPRGLVYAYEPDQQIFSQLQKNVEINRLKNVQTYAIALQDDQARDRISFHIRRAIDGDGHENQGLSSLMPLSLHHQSTENVAASTIDREVQRHDLHRLDLLKIDVEGAELLVLGGPEVDREIPPNDPVRIIECSR